MAFSRRANTQLSPRRDSSPPRSRRWSHIWLVMVAPLRSLSARPRGPFHTTDVICMPLCSVLVQRGGAHTRTLCPPVTHSLHLHHLRQRGCVPLLSTSVCLSVRMPVSQGKSAGREIKSCFCLPCTNPSVWLNIRKDVIFKLSCFKPFMNPFLKKSFEFRYLVELHDETLGWIQSLKTSSVKL